MKKQFIACLDSPHQWGNEHEKRRKRALTSKRENSARESIITSHPQKAKVFQKTTYYHA